MQAVFTRADWDRMMDEIASTARAALDGAAGPLFDDVDLAAEPVSLVVVVSEHGVAIHPYIGDALLELTAAGVRLDEASGWARWDG